MDPKDDNEHASISSYNAFLDYIFGGISPPPPPPACLPTTMPLQLETLKSRPFPDCPTESSSMTQRNDELCGGLDMARFRNSASLLHPKKTFFIISQWITVPLAFIITSVVVFGMVKSIPTVIIKVCAVPVFICGAQVALSALMLIVGFISRVANLDPNPPMACEVSGEVAMLMLVYNEDPAPVVKRLQCMMQSFESLNAARKKIRWFVLSDTQNTEIAAHEEVIFARHLPQVTYRRRVRNTRYKTGNLREWMASYGESGVGRFEYMCVLDTDSVIEADCLLLMWRTMEQDKQIAIVQSTILPVYATSIFSRLMQHAAQTAIHTYITGYAITHGGHSLYVGHNCLIRIAPFFQLCALDEHVPLFGGHVMSHDFVESLILASKGWKVINLVTDDGSYEELPPTLLDYMKRDQRWCLGNLQHMVLAFSMKEIDFFSRLQLVQSGLAYLNSVLWIWIVLMGAFGIVLKQHQETKNLVIMLTIFSFLLIMCFPLLSLAECHMSSHKVARADFPKFGIHLMGVALTIVYTALLTPGLALFHARVILMFLVTGKRVTWEPQNREESGLSFKACMQACVLQTVSGILLALLVIITNIFTARRMVFLSCLLGISAFGMLMFGPLMWFTSKSSGRFHERFWQCKNSIPGFSTEQLLDTCSSRSSGTSRQDHHSDEDYDN
jgi:membrane glycosyltransferase